ncbi:MAG: HEAT repeat domain-containing protein [Elusimicrobia bacterium]|nr:HEAT repeat domain-containing protein [Elusimicrobiota bacterium]
MSLARRTLRSSPGMWRVVAAGLGLAAATATLAPATPRPNETPQPASASEDLLQAFIQACRVERPNQGKCAEAGKALGGADASTVAALARLLKHKEYNVAMAAASTLGNMGGARAGPAAPALARSLTHWHGSVRRTAAAALIKLSPDVPETTQLVLALLEDPRNWVRSLAVKTLGGMGAKARDAAAALNRVRQGDEDKQIRAQAAKAVEKITGKPPRGPSAPAELLPENPGLKAFANSYLDKYDALSSTETTANLDVFDLYKSAQSLLRSLDRWMNTATMEEALRLRSQIPGILIEQGGEGLRSAPDIVFFKQLARTRREETTIDFFDQLAQLYPDSLRAAYETRAGEYGNCTRFEEDSFGRLYRAWDGFQASEPKFQLEIAAVKERIIEGLLSTCICGERESNVLSEYKSFVQLYPDHPAAARIQKRMEDVRAKQVRLHLNCKPG